MISWNAATATEQAGALVRLDAVRAGVAQLRDSVLAKGSGNDAALLGQLLKWILHHPTPALFSWSTGSPSSHSGIRPQRRATARSTPCMPCVPPCPWPRQCVRRQLKRRRRLPPSLTRRSNAGHGGSVGGFGWHCCCCCWPCCSACALAPRIWCRAYPCRVPLRDATLPDVKLSTPSLPHAGTSGMGIPGGAALTGSGTGGDFALPGAQRGAASVANAPACCCAPAVGTLPPGVAANGDAKLPAQSAVEGPGTLPSRQAAQGADEHGYVAPPTCPTARMTCGFRRMPAMAMPISSTATGVQGPASRTATRVNRCACTISQENGEGRSRSIAITACNVRRRSALQWTRARYRSAIAWLLDARMVAPRHALDPVQAGHDPSPHAPAIMGMSFPISMRRVNPNRREYLPCCPC